MQNFNFYLKQSWNSFYPETRPNEIIKSKEITKRYEISQGDNKCIYIYDVIFNEIHNYHEFGGAILINATNSNFLVIFTSFIECTSFGIGNGVYLEFTNGQSVISRCCSIGCHTTYNSTEYKDGQFANLNVGKDESITNKNMVLDTVVCYSKTIDEKIETRTPLCLNNGFIELLNNNITQNYIYRISAFYCYTLHSDKETCSIRYSTISNNYAYYGICIEVEEPKLKSSMRCCNFINNSQHNNTFGLIKPHGPMLIIDCCILDNDDVHDMFYLNYEQDSRIEIVNCTINENVLTKANSISLVYTKSWFPIFGTFEITMKYSNFEYCEAPFITKKYRISTKLSFFIAKYVTQIVLGNLKK